MPGVGLLDHMVVLFLVFYGTSILFSIVAVPTYTFSTRVWKGYLFSSLPFQYLLFVDFFFNDGHSDWSEVWYLIVVLICIFLISSGEWVNVIHLYDECYLAIRRNAVFTHASTCIDLKRKSS